ncbi:MAG TPA: hypothetical protein DCY53_04555 [Desulfobacteraceae bacterium]|jgi:hypothetical protein|nr:hypothetical protein [Desulfobacteraceae bacterium]
MNKPKNKANTSHLPIHQLALKFETELPPHGFATCLSCKTMKDLGIKGFNNIPGNCRSPQQEDSWCSLLHLVFTIAYK